MRKLLLSLAFLTIFLPHLAYAQAIVLPCVPSGNSCIPVSAANPLPTTGGTAASIDAGGATVITNGQNGGVFFQNGASPVGTLSNSTSFTYVDPGQLILALGTITTNLKAISITGTVNNAGTTFDAPLFMNIANTASAAGSLIADFQRNGVSIWSFGLTNGQLSITSGNADIISSGNLYLDAGAGSSFFMRTTGNAAALSVTGQQVTMSTLSATPVEIVNGTNPQSMRTYNTSSSANANYERGVFGFTDTSNVLTIGTQNAGTGLARAVQLVTGGTLAVTISTAQLVTFAGQVNVAAMTQTAAAQSGTVCYNSGTGAVTYDATLGCLASTMEVKHDWRAFTPREALSIVTRLEAGAFVYKAGMGLPDGPQIGLSAQQVASIDDRLVGYDNDGRLRGVRYQQTSALYGPAIRAISDEVATLRADNDNLRIELETIKRSIAR